MNLRKLARGRDCMIRSPVCCFDSDTTVLCHLNGAGMGRKHHDLVAAWGCSSCHAWVDGGYAKAGYSKDERDLAHLRGMQRTLEALIDDGVIG